MTYHVPGEDWTSSVPHVGDPVHSPPPPSSVFYLRPSSPSILPFPASLTLLPPLLPLVLRTGLPPCSNTFTSDSWMGRPPHHTSPHRDVTRGKGNTSATNSKSERIHSYSGRDCTHTGVVDRVRSVCSRVFWTYSRGTYLNPSTKVPQFLVLFYSPPLLHLLFHLPTTVRHLRPPNKVVCPHPVTSQDSLPHLTSRRVNLL